MTLWCFLLLLLLLWLLLLLLLHVQSTKTISVFKVELFCWLWKFVLPVRVRENVRIIQYDFKNTIRRISMIVFFSYFYFLLGYNNFFDCKHSYFASVRFIFYGNARERERDRERERQRERVCGCVCLILCGCKTSRSLAKQFDSWHLSIKYWSSLEAHSIWKRNTVPRECALITVRFVKAYK